MAEKFIFYGYYSSAADAIAQIFQKELLQNNCEKDERIASEQFYYPIKPCEAALKEYQKSLEEMEMLSRSLEQPQMIKPATEKPSLST
ncbi:hypothetical protein C5167_011698 [Papaver somniferum]|uniref:Uncharacterized protein n=1 Tax=Papaver somniferum TaxID=3469 RepID=A0A4Y7K7L6_PAPSO|nr:hypothetical protein C5167_011698 [Papaver somniferum]